MNTIYQNITRYLLICLSLIVSTTIYAQVELCCNGIDDDGDMLIDIMDTTDCPDKDGDSVPDECDLDDDNDGILDCVEAYNGKGTLPMILGTDMQLGESEVTATATASGDYFAGFPTMENTTDNQYLNFVVTAGTGNTIQYDVDFSLPIGITIEPPASDASNQYFLTNDEVDTWCAPGGLMTITNPTNQLQIDTNGDGVLEQNVTSHTAECITFSLNPPWTGGTSVSLPHGTGNFSITTEGNVTSLSFTQENLNNIAANGVKYKLLFNCVPLDTDGDGLTDDCDLDSDGDGCPDAVEGSADFSIDDLMASGIDGGSTSVNENLGNDVDADGVPIVANGGQDLLYADDSLIDACLDKDQDGISDVADLDDDNDGILDLVECPPLPWDVYFGHRSNPAGNHPTNLPVRVVGATTSDYTVNQKDVPDDLFYDDGISDGNSNRGFHLVATGIQAAADNSLEVSLRPDANTDGFFLLCDVVLLTNGVDTVIIDNSQSGFSVTGAGWNSQNLNQCFLNNERFINATNYTQGGRVATFAFTDLPIALDMTCDEDGDGLLNSCDLDSDGDGCPDAVEGGADIALGDLQSSSIDGGSTGISENITQMDVDANGVPNAVSGGQSINLALNDSDITECDASSCSAGNEAPIILGN